MAKYLDKEMFLQSMGLLGDETKYGNRDREHQSRSYSTWMGYEIMNSVEDSVVEEDVMPVVRCKDCKYYEATANSCFNRHWDMESATEVPFVCGSDFCSYGERKDNE